MKVKTAEEREKETNELLNTVRWLLVVACVLLAGNLWRAEEIGDTADKSTIASEDAEDAATRAADASEKASDELGEALKAAADPAAVSRSRNAFNNVNIIREILCLEFSTSCAAALEKYPPPPDPPTTTTTSPGG